MKEERSVLELLLDCALCWLSVEGSNDAKNRRNTFITWHPQCSFRKTLKGDDMLFTV